MLVVSDAEWIKEAWIKHFKVFTNRRRVLFGGSLDQGLFSIEGDHWRHIRQRLSPEFSSGKLKNVCISFTLCISVWILLNMMSMSQYGLS